MSCWCWVAQSCQTLWPHELQHTRLPCPSLCPRVCADSYQLSWSCHPSISFSATPFSFCPKSFPASGSYPVSWRFASGGQSTRASASASILLMKIQGWFPLGWIGLISLLSFLCRHDTFFFGAPKTSCLQMKKLLATAAYTLDDIRSQKSLDSLSDYQSFSLSSPWASCVGLCSLSSQHSIWHIIDGG